jgi:hypothetical protein
VSPLGRLRLRNRRAIRRRRSTESVDALDGNRPTPAHTGFRALFNALEDDITHLPSKQNLYMAGIGGGHTLAVHPFD